MKHISDIKIKDAAPHIFTRPFLFVEPNTRMLQIGTYLAIGPQIYVDGLVVISENDKGQRGGPLGRIGCKHIMSNLLDFDYPAWLDTKASQIMDSTVVALEMDSTLSSVLEIFEKTRFAFVPIVAKRDIERDGGSGPSVVTAALAIRDVLPLIVKANITMPIRRISSPLVSVDGNTSVMDALRYMIRTGIRNIGIKEDVIIDVCANICGIKDGAESHLVRIVNDRKILEFLFSHNGREILRKNGVAGLRDINIINHLDIISMARVKSETTISKAAELLLDIRNPCLISEGYKGEDTNHYIVTPWDVVMKTLKSENTLA
jgi:CBS domain-containing protein